MVKFSDNLKHILRERSMSMTVFAQFIDVAPSSVSMWCNGQSIPSQGNLDKICKTLNISLKALMGVDLPAQDSKPDNNGQFSLIEETSPYEVIDLQTAKFVARNIDIFRKIAADSSAQNSFLWYVRHGANVLKAAKSFCLTLRAEGVC